MPLFHIIKVGQGHPRAMVHTDFVERHCMVLYTKFQSHRPSGSGDENF